MNVHQPSAAGAGNGAESHPKTAAPVWPALDANEYCRSGYGTIRTVYGVVSVYPVGVLEALRYFRRQYRWCRETGRPTRIAWVRLWSRRTYLLRQLRARNWRAVKCSFNGWMAEPDWPSDLPGKRWRRCGTGWTPNRALRRLEREIWKANTLEEMR